MPGAPKRSCVPTGAAPKGGGEGKITPHMPLLGGRAEERGSFAWLWGAESESGWRWGCWALRARTQTAPPSPEGSVPRSCWSLGRTKAAGGGVLEPEREGQESWGNFNQLPKQTEVRGGIEVPAPAAGSGAGTLPGRCAWPRAPRARCT